jgi:aryl-alcohol dehydrogenase-like predicted oxidoreductase
MTATRETVQANVTERCQRLGVNKVDLLQFHWQFVSLHPPDYPVSQMLIL